MTQLNASASQLLVSYLSLFDSLKKTGVVLDLACGTGRNGLLLARQGMEVIFADRNPGSLSQVQQQLEREGLKGRTWQVDLEVPGQDPLAGSQFDAVVVFNYLHRPLMPALKRAIKSGGIIIYETFTVAQREYGRPSNPDFLLLPGELQGAFSDWQLLHYFEGQKQEPQRAVASLIARKP